MPLRSLVFSSDRGTAHLLAESLHELGMEVEHCPEIFGAVERLTLQSFDVLVVDWSDEPEASFLLRAAREMKSSEPPFPVAVVEVPSSVNEAMRAGANHVLVKDQAHIDLFQVNGGLWGPRVADRLENTAEQDQNLTPPEREPRFDPPTNSLGAGYLKQDPALAFAGYAGSRVGRHRKAVRRAELSPATIESRHGYKNAVAFVGMVIAMFVSVWRLGPVVNATYSPSHSAGIFAKADALQVGFFNKFEQWWKPSPDRDDTVSSDTPLEQLSVETNRVPNRSVVKPSPAPLVSPQLDFSGDMALLPLSELQPSPVAFRTDTESAPIPESLKRPPEGLSMRSVVANITPTLLGALEPVLVPEEVSRKLLLQKVQPSYPEQALRAGLQGSVILQAWIGRDGKIRDLKLVRGYLVLGRAAVDAVKQWRYQPYLRNGQAMETQTYITVNFTPSLSNDRDR